MLYKAEADGGAKELTAALKSETNFAGWKWAIVPNVRTFKALDSGTNYATGFNVTIVGHLTVEEAERLLSAAKKPS
jgi:hypothetical protein